MAVMVKVDGKKFNKNNSGEFLLPHPGFTMNQHKIHLAELLLLNFLPSTYTITAISWLPPLVISQLFFHSGHFEQGVTFFLQPGCFRVYITSFCNSTCVFLKGLRFYTILADVYV